MPAVTIKPDIYWIGVNDHTTDLFEGLWPITREGVSYNSYLFKGEKNAVIDLAKSTKLDEFIDRISEVIPVSSIDYIILNHMEPDHTGLLKVIRELAPQSEILCSAKAAPMVKNFFAISDLVRIVADGEELDLGGKLLKFFMTPFVHWPETMMTYETASKNFFTRDAFGSYGWSGGARRELDQRFEGLKWEMTAFFDFAGGPTLEDYRVGGALGKKFGETILQDS